MELRSLVKTGVFILLLSCSHQEEENTKVVDAKSIKLFETIPPSESGIDFVNAFRETTTLNYYTYKHLYIGGGVATGDINNDGLPDIYFTGNLSPNKLYLNKGNFQFEDITEQAGAVGSQGFYMGVTMADVNHDGWLDIYLCKSGKYRDSRVKENVLLINNGDLTFSEKARDFGLNDASQSVQSAFLDYDLDGDLDMFLVNTPVDFTISQQAYVLDFVHRNPQFRKLGGNDQLYRNEGNGRFTKVTEQAGILPDLGFGLNVSVADFNRDCYPDIFVANDFVAPDYLYINNGNGTFSEKGKSWMRHTSFYSMGSDPSDINNDGLPDLVVLDMNPEDYRRSKTTMEMMDRDLFQRVADAGYNFIYMHNMMHVNTGMGSFSELSQLAGISNTDWSWSSMVADYDNDGYKDLHITNGIYRDVLDRDIKSTLKDYSTNGKPLTPEQAFEHLRSFPSEKLPNYLYRNENGYQFQDLARQWGTDRPSFSNGSAVADLDQDGDLDLVVNNLMDTAFLYRNQAELTGNRYLQVSLQGPEKNPFGYGAEILLQAGDKTQFYQVQSTKGYLSASEAVAHFGLGPESSVDQVTVTWPDGSKNVLTDIGTNQKISVQHSRSSKINHAETADHLFKEVSDLMKPSYRHRENKNDDYLQQVLLPYKYSQLGPTLAVGDLNGDGLDDFFVGGAHGQPGAIYLQSQNGDFIISENAAFSQDATYEDTGSIFLDFDGDNDPDLYVASGGYEFDDQINLLQDRLYRNNGSGSFKRVDNLPAVESATAAVAAIDMDGDGDQDLFVGGRVVPGKYPLPPRSYLLVNENGIFLDKTSELSPDLQHTGMITDAQWADFNGDGTKDLMVVGEWMSPRIFVNDNHQKLVPDAGYFPRQSKVSGWWQTSLCLDLNQDGALDLLIGNFGLNLKFKASEEKPFKVYASDFDDNNTFDVFLTKNIGKREVPVRGKECSTEQIPKIGETFKTFQEFAAADIEQILGPSIENALHLEVKEFKTTLFTLQGNTFQPSNPLPMEVQFSAVIGVDYLDVNGDGLEDVILAGNVFQMEVETTRLDAGTGFILLNNGHGEFQALSSNDSGFYVPYDVKALKVMCNTADGQPLVLVGVNNEPLKMFRLTAGGAGTI